MKREILDNSRNFLRIFTEPIIIDYSLPKFDKIFERLIEDEKEKSKIEAMYSYGIHPTPVTPDLVEISGINDRAKRAAYKKRLLGGLEISERYFNEISIDELNVMISDHRNETFKKSLLGIVYEDPDASLVWNTTNNESRINYFLNNISFEEEPSVLVDHVDGRSEKRSILSKIKKLLGKKVVTDQKPPTVSKKNIMDQIGDFELDVIQFFDVVKLETREEAIDYYRRIMPLIIAIKEANEMGQSALVEKYLGVIVLSKYESFLKVKGFNKKISETKLVDFVKKTEKGVRLDYIQNFSRHLPDSVREKKKLADSLKVFDNYVILHFDPDAKSYVETVEEKESIRAKKADPILFGIIDGVRALYYITDWVDEYCDLTLDKFLTISGIDSKKLLIDEKIVL